MPMHGLVPPDPNQFLKDIAGNRPLAIVLAGHNGSGKSTFWYQKLADALQIPLINADRLTMSILPEVAGNPPRLRPWAAKLRDGDERWQRLSQTGVALFIDEVMGQQMPFGFETVFSYLQENEDGTFRSKAEIITKLQRAGYAVALMFVGLANVELSVLRVQSRTEKGGHAVPLKKLLQRFPRTREAIRLASSIADMTLMFDNSRTPEKAFTLARVQTGTEVIYDCRLTPPTNDPGLVSAASAWLQIVAPQELDATSGL